MKIKVLLVSLSFTTLVTLALPAQGAEITDQVKATWKKECAKCHNENGDGHTKMGRILKIIDYTDPQVQAKLKEDEMHKAIKDGVVKNGKKKMKAYGDQLSDDEIKGLIAYIHTFSKSK